MNTLIESIQTQGVLSPLIVRPIENTEEYEVVSGHRRLHAAQKAGITEVPALVYALDRDAAAEVVRRIYHLCLEGKGPEQIARLLQREKVLTPTAYYYSVGSSSANRPMPSNPYLWKDSTIDAILSNRKYTGCMVNLKTTTVSYKVHKLIRKPEEEWSIVPNAQEAIIDENTWLRVQELRKHKRRPTATGKTSLFSGLVFCADCGSKLHFCAAKSLKANQEFFRCANYKGPVEAESHQFTIFGMSLLEQIVSVAVSGSCRFRHLSDESVLSAPNSIWKATICGERSEYPIC